MAEKKSESVIREIKRRTRRKYSAAYPVPYPAIGGNLCKCLQEFGVMACAGNPAENGHLSSGIEEWALRESNPQPTDYESAALPLS